MEWCRCSSHYFTPWCTFAACTPKALQALAQSTHLPMFLCAVQIPLTICSYKDLYGWTMDEIVAQIGTKNNCTFCGVFRRQVRQQFL